MRSISTAMGNRLVWIAGIGVTLALALATALATRQYGALVPGAVAAALLGFFAFAALARRPIAALHVYIIVLPASTLLLILAYHYLRLPPRVMKLALYWEELLAVAVFALTTWWIAPALIRADRVRLHLADVVALLLALQVLVYALIGVQNLGSLGLTGYLRALRDQLLYLMLYFVGRNFVVSDIGSWKILRSLAWVAIGTSLFGFFERFAIPIQWFLTIEAPRFFLEVVGIQFSPNSFGLPENFWTSVGGTTVRRATSVYASSQPFAISFLLLLPACMWLGATRYRPSQLRFIPSAPAMSLWSLVCLGGLLLTITRMNIIIGAVQVAIALLLFSRRLRFLNRGMFYILSFSLLGAALVALIFFDPIVRFAHTTLTFQESSSYLHQQSLLVDWEHLLSFPFGRGLGMAGVTAARAGIDVASAAGGEGQYSKFVRELGWSGLLLYVGLVATISLHALRQYRARRSENMGAGGLAFVIALAGVGILINAVTTEWQGALATSFVFWWLAGGVVGYRHPGKPS